MTHMLSSLRQVSLLARLSFLETRRQGSLQLLLLAATVLVVSTRELREFNFGSSERRFVFDLGSGIIACFGSVLSASTVALLVSGEEASRVAATWLAKPIRKGEFLAGRYLGALGVLTCFSLITTALLAAILLVCQDGRAGEALLFDDVAGGLHLFAVVIMGFVHWLEFALIAALTLLVASYARSTAYTIVMSLTVWSACQLQSWISEPMISPPGGLAYSLSRVMAWLVPDFRVFGLAGSLPESGSFGPVTLAWLTADAALHIAGFGTLAIFSFKRRGS